MHVEVRTQLDVNNIIRSLGQELRDITVPAQTYLTLDEEIRKFFIQNTDLSSVLKVLQEVAPGFVSYYSSQMNTHIRPDELGTDKKEYRHPLYQILYQVAEHTQYTREVQNREATVGDSKKWVDPPKMTVTKADRKEGSHSAMAKRHAEKFTTWVYKNFEGADICEIARIVINLLALDNPQEPQLMQIAKALKEEQEIGMAENQNAFEGIISDVLNSNSLQAAIDMTEFLRGTTFAAEAIQDHELTTLDDEITEAEGLEMGEKLFFENAIANFLTGDKATLKSDDESCQFQRVDQTMIYLLNCLKEYHNFCHDQGYLTKIAIDSVRGLALGIVLSKDSGRRSILNDALLESGIDDSSSYFLRLCKNETDLLPHNHPVLRALAGAPRQTP